MGRLLPLCLLALAAAFPFPGRAAARVAGPVEVVAVQATRAADLVILGGGFTADLRPGMVCRIARGTTDIAEVLLVELRPTCGVAVIVKLVPRQSIQAGDLASIKTLKT